MSDFITAVQPRRVKIGASIPHWTLETFEAGHPQLLGGHDLQINQKLMAKVTATATVTKLETSLLKVRMLHGVQLTFASTSWKF